MSVYHCLALIEPLDGASGVRRAVRVSSANMRGINGLDGESWNPAMSKAPSLSLRLFNGDFGDAVRPGGASLSLDIATIEEVQPDAGAWLWPNAPVTIWYGQQGEGWPWVQCFKGRVSGFTREANVLALDCDVDLDPFNADLLTATYAGTGDEEGPEDLKNRVKPLVIGWASNVEPVTINAVDSIYQFSAYGPIEAVTALYERGASFGTATGDHADYTALAAASIPAGRWATCLAEGLIRLGAPPFGVITGDVKGHEVAGETPRLPGAIITALAEIAGVDDLLLLSATLDAMDAACPYPCDLVLQEQATFEDIARQLALQCNYQAGVSLLGQFMAVRIALDEPEAITLHAQGRRMPQVIACKEVATSAPYWKTTLGANRCWRVHSKDEIAYSAELIDRGVYDAGETYREGNIVSLGNKSQWVYINPAPTAGNAPPTWPTTSNAWWANISPPAQYSDGTDIDDLQPLEPDADVTRAIVGPAETVVDCESTGTPKAGQVNPRYVQFLLYRGGVDETTSATWAVSVGFGSLAASIGAATGLLNLTSAATDGELIITATIGGVDTVFAHRIRRTVASSTSGGSGVSSDNGSVNGSPSSTTLVAIGDELQVTVGSSGNVDLYAEYQFATSQTAGFQSADTRWYEWNGSAYVAIGTLTGSSTSYSYSFGEPGFGFNAHTATGLTPASTARFRLYGASMSSWDTYFSGSCTAVSS